jgi:ribosomal protein S27AE
MDIRVAQGCPQCGAPADLAEADQLLTCGFCGTCNYLQTQGPFRYVLPLPKSVGNEGFVLAPYLRFKGTIYLVSDHGIEHRVIDTTQAASPMAGLPPSLGLRPQAMGLHRLDPQAVHRYLPQSIRANVILEKAASVGNLGGVLKEGLHHRAYIGESLSYIYLPIAVRSGGLVDAVNGSQLCDLEEAVDQMVQGRVYNPAWSVRFLATLCPHCGAAMEGVGKSRVLLCTNCHSGWALGADGLTRVEWSLQPGETNTALYLPFWKIIAHIPVLSIYSFADFIERTNQPMLPRPRWRERAMSFWIPAIKLRPKIFLQAGRQVTLGQWRLKLEEGRVSTNFFPATLPASEARQAVKLMLAATTTSPQRVFPFLPQVRLTETMVQLVYLPCADRGHDWVQPETGMTIAKNILHFGRSL